MIGKAISECKHKTAVKAEIAREPEDNSGLRADIRGVGVRSVIHVRQWVGLR